MVPAGSRPGTSLVRARLACAAIFAVTGSLFGNWVSRLPAIKDQVGAGTGTLGLALLGIAIGALLSKQVAGQLVARVGSRPVTRIGVVSSCLTLVPPAMSGDAVALAATLFAFGIAMGLLDVAMNAQAVTVQARLGRPVMSSFHGLYSVGGLLGALAGGGAAAQGLTPLAHFAAAAVLLGGAAAAASAWLLPERPSSGSGHRGRAWISLPTAGRTSLVLLGFVGLCSSAGEGAAADWSAIYLRDALGTSESFAVYSYAGFSVSMAAGRLLGDRVIARWGDVPVVTWSLVLAAAGFGLGLLAHTPTAAICGFAVLGAGLSVVVPVAFSIGGRLGGDAAGPAITVVSSISGMGFLAGPPAIGWAAELIGLPLALGLVSVLVTLAVVLIRVAVPSRPPATGHRPPATAASTRSGEQDRRER